MLEGNVDENEHASQLIGEFVRGENGTAVLCAIYETYSLARFLYIVFATVLAVGGLFGNILLLVIFTKQSCATTPPTLYPSALALADAIICASYTFLFGADAIISYLRIEKLFLLYYIYIIPAFVISRIAQLAVPYMLIFATLERLNWISDRREESLLRRMYSREGRFACVITAVTVCVLLRLPTAWALEVVEYPDCPDYFRTLTTDTAPWTENNELWYFFDFHILVIAQTVLPFILLIILNTIIIRSLLSKKANINKKASAIAVHEVKETSVEAIDYKNGLMTGMTMTTSNGSSMVPIVQVRSTQRQVRSAIITMVVIVISYLVCNSLHLILTILERSEAPILFDPADPLLSSTFHTTCSDLISFLYMFTSGIRLCIYAAVNLEFREDLLHIFSKHPPPQPL